MSTNRRSCSSAPSEGLTQLLLAGEESSSDEELSFEAASPVISRERAEWTLVAHAELRAVHDALGQTAASLRAREASVAERERAVAHYLGDKHSETVSAGGSLAKAAAAAGAGLGGLCAGALRGAGGATGLAALAEVSRDEAVLRQLLQEEAARLTARTRQALEERADARVRQLEQIVADLRRRHEELSRARLAAERTASVRGGKRHADRLHARIAEQAARKDGGATAAHARDLGVRLSHSRGLVAALLPLWSESAHQSLGLPMDDEAISGAVDAFVSVRLTSHAGTALVRLLWHVTCGEGAAAGSRLHSGRVSMNADAAAEAPGRLDLGGSENTPPGLAGAPLLPALAPAAGRAGRSTKGLNRPGGGLSGRSGAQWERRLIRHLYTELESCKPEGASSRPSHALLACPATDVPGADSVAASHLWAAVLLLRLSMCHADGRVGAGGGAGGAGGAHASEMLVALRVLQSLLGETSLRPQLIRLAFPTLLSVLPSPHTVLSIAASGLLLVTAASGEHTEEALAALSTPSFFRAAAAALKREGSSSEGDDSLAAILCVLLQVRPNSPVGCRGVRRATGDNTHLPASATPQANIKPPAIPSAKLCCFSGESAPPDACVSPPSRKHSCPLGADALHTPRATTLLRRARLARGSGGAPASARRRTVPRCKRPLHTSQHEGRRARERRRGRSRHRCGWYARRCRRKRNGRRGCSRGPHPRSRRPVLAV